MTQKRADIAAIRKALDSSLLEDKKPLVAYVMRKSGCSFTEISELTGKSRQRAAQMVKRAEEKLNK